MSPDPAISVVSVSKAYRIWDNPASRLTAPLWEAAAKVVPGRLGLDRRAARSSRQFWALKNIGLEVQRGESVGIIGLNGSGKSTLLQIIAGTLQPSTGSVQVRGRVAALLELGSGFNPDFTGRENVFLNAAVLGLSQEETAQRFPQIAEFAAIGDFMEQPVKTYSTGMQVRLAFAVLAQVEPEILIVDEALSVGDFLFQQKCFDRIRDFRRRGCTFLFVSHGLGTVLELCDRAIVLDRGEMIFQGRPKDAIDLYEAHALRTRFGITKTEQLNPVATATPPPDGATVPAPHPGAEPAIVSGALTLLSVRILDAGGVERNFITSGQEVQIRITIRLHRAAADPHIGFRIRNHLGMILYETNTYCLRTYAGPVPADTEVQATFRMRLPLIEGEYSITAGVANGGQGRAEFAEALHFQHDTCCFVVIRDWSAPHWAGLANLGAVAEVETRPAASAAKTLPTR